MNTICFGLRVINHHSKILRRGLRRLPKRSSLEASTIPVSSRPNIPVLQAPLTEKDLLIISGSHPQHEELKKTEQPKASPHQKHVEKKKLLQTQMRSLKEKVKPDFNKPLNESVTAENQHEKVTQVVTPLCQMPYGNQRKLKEKNVSEILKTLRKRLSEVHAPFDKSTRNGLPCFMEPLRPSPSLIGYRNKDEFGIHFGIDRNPKTVGFFVGKPTDPLITCVPPTFLINMKESHKHIAERFQTFIRQSPHDACHRFDTGGIWRNLVVRSTESDERMAVVYIHPQNLTEDEIVEIMGNLKEFFFHGEGLDCELDSLYLQACRHTKCTREQAPYRLIEGKEYITEMINGLSICISPDSFFQVNTGGAELLYNTVREVAEVSPLTTLLDVCCGTGTISLVMSPFVRGTVGIEINSGALEDAKRNALINKVSNSQFLLGAAEKVLPRIMNELNFCTDVVAIVNPARAGLKPNVIKAIRQCEAITKLVYISCQPEGTAMDNFVHLAATKTKGKMEKTTPFIPKYVVPIDMFPHTYHTEVVILFERQLE